MMNARPIKLRKSVARVAAPPARKKRGSPPAPSTRAPVGQLGNLVLVSPEMSGRLSNKFFAEKKRILKAAGFPIPKEIAESDEWAMKEIKARTDSMADYAYQKLWKI
jgi:hypothetical protein